MRLSLDISQKVKSAYEQLKNEAAIFHMIPSYHSILIEYDYLHCSIDEIKTLVLSKLKTPSTSSLQTGKLIEVPVYYGIEVGFDLERIANYANCSIQEVINRHSQKEYMTYAIGFAPGFAYLGEVDDSIAVSRLSTPRSKVPKGSVAIANTQNSCLP